MSQFKNLFSLGGTNKLSHDTINSKPSKSGEKNKEIDSGKSKTYGLFEKKILTDRRESTETPHYSSSTGRIDTERKNSEPLVVQKKFSISLNGFLTSRKTKARSMKDLAKVEGVDPETMYKGYVFMYEDAMKQKKVKQLFAKYLKDIHNEEQFLFLEEVEKYKLMMKKSDKERYNKAKDIISRFIVVFAENEINISNDQRKEIVEKFDKHSSTNSTSINLFDELYSDIHLSLKIDSFKRFVQSKLFKDFCDTCDQELFLSFAQKYEKENSVRIFKEIEEEQVKE